MQQECSGCDDSTRVKADQQLLKDAGAFPLPQESLGLQLGEDFSSILDPLFWLSPVPITSPDSLAHPFSGKALSLEAHHSMVPAFQAGIQSRFVKATHDATRSLFTGLSFIS